MTKRLVDLRMQIPLLDIASHGRRGPGHRALTPAQIQQISRTVRRVPEVMVKVSGGAHTARGVATHLAYIGREGEGALETDEGTVVKGKGIENDLVEDWDMDLPAERRYPGSRSPKLVHNLVFSMPRGTPPQKLFGAVRIFAREQFALKHRYAMALHTDQGHPHVHVVVKAQSEQGGRLNIRKATLRDWRQEFARHLREQGIEANATERAVRGQIKTPKKDGIHRAALRGESTYYQNRARAAARAIAQKQSDFGSQGSERLASIRADVVQGWRGVAVSLEQDGHHDLAATLTGFVGSMPPALTDRQQIYRALNSKIRRQQPIREVPLR